ncbi:Ldh family oxidoreductase [Thermodesulfobacteriota bacterium]
MDVSIQPKELLELAQTIFISKGVSEQEARLVSDMLVEANLRGHDSHGVIRIPKWTTGLKAGAINPIAKVQTVQETAASALLDGGSALGPVVGCKASDMAIQKAKSLGIGIVVVRKASHIGMLGYYTEYMAKQGVIGICMTNSESGVAPFGTADKILGTNPLSIGVPTRTWPMILDMSTSVVARGKIVVALESGEKIPLGWALNKNGDPTTDPKEALEGVLLPFGGMKGSGLAIMVDILSGALAGQAVGRDVKGTFDMKNEGTKGDMFMAIEPSVFIDIGRFLDTVESLKGQIKGAKKAKGVDNILLPGEYEYLMRKKRVKDGIPINKELLNILMGLKML